jgi:monovalent cation:H+ antiporter-2, CPA2 family
MAYPPTPTPWSWNMFSLNFGLSFLIISAVAVAGGLLARRFRLPTILGYLVGGIAIGPYGFAVIHEATTVDAFANLGIILLLFTIGLEFPIKEFVHLGKITVFGGLAQIILTTAVGVSLGLWLGTGLTGSIFFGFLIAFSSTMIVLKILAERGETNSEHGRILMGILLIQDIIVVPLVVILPMLNGDGSELLPTLGFAALKAVLYIALTVGLGIWVIPWLFRKVASEHFRELFLLTVIILVLASAFGSNYLGLSFAFGGFIAGLLIGQSIFARQAVADIIPLRDAFVALFFVSLGMLFDPQFFIHHPLVVAVFLIIILVTKFLIGFFVPWFAGRHLKISLFIGVGLIPIGEFSFALAGIGKQSNVISDYTYNLILACAIITLFLAPFSFDFIGFVYRRYSQSNRFKSLIDRRSLKPLEKKLDISRHAVICGYGKIGNTLAQVLDKRKFPYLVIDLDPYVISKLHSQNIPALFGDASNPEILAQAQLNKANILICSFTDSLAAEITVRNAHKVNPDLHIITRANNDSAANSIMNNGASETVRPEFEAGLEIIRYTLRRYGVTSLEIQSILSRLRTGD